MINREYFEGWVTGTRSTYGDDPTEYNGHDIDYCKNCGEEPKDFGIDVCPDCVDHFEEMKQTSLCCGDTLDVDTKRCTCGEWSESMFDEHCEEHNFNKSTYKYEYNNKKNEDK